ncbi:alpha/beta hydrolase [Zavarzinia compransoris]|uniref:alpha/beta hydrolase n=1 Tax=Zavarzinia marina TaxID=2911065 RepID=UPI001F21AA75|nr:alpha/beta hydrolase [Zavarzinia marina]MCF4165299.1 alpha/beta hydrolase [Zavarzinia marina]
MSLVFNIQRMVRNGIAGVSAPVLASVAALSPAIIDGKRLNPQLQTFAALQGRLFPMHRFQLRQARSLYRFAMKSFAVASRPMALVEELSIPGELGPIRARLFVPPGLTGPMPLTVYFHGGGFVLGDIDGYDSTCRHIAARARCAVLSVDYRLAPEHPMPAAVIDAGAVWRWLLDSAADLRVDPARMAVAGDSAGGLLSAMVCLMARDAGIQAPCHQLLIYPATDGRMNTRSAELYGRGFILEKQLTDWFRALAAGGLTDEEMARVMPIHADRFDDLPSATVVVAGFDPLYDEGVAYAGELREAGVRVELQDHPDMLHGFLTFTGSIPRARYALDQAAGSLRRALWVGHTLPRGRSRPRTMLLPESA